MRPENHVPASIARIAEPPIRSSAQPVSPAVHRRVWPLTSLLLALLLALGFAGTAPSSAQSDDNGLFLVAQHSLGDPLFKESVVLMLPRDETLIAPGDEPSLVVGLIVNKPSHVRLRELFPKAANAPQKQDATAYFGGPVEPSSLGAIFRSTSPPKNSISVFADVCVTFDADVVSALADGSLHASSMHIFLGRSQWSTVQLHNEIAKHAWYTFRGDADPIFTARPDAAWRALLQKLDPRPMVFYQPPSAPNPQCRPQAELRTSRCG